MFWNGEWRWIFERNISQLTYLYILGYIIIITLCTKRYEHIDWINYFNLFSAYEFYVASIGWVPMNVDQ